MDRFTDFLNIEAPKYEYFTGIEKPANTRRPEIPYYQSTYGKKTTRFVRIHSPRGMGEWCFTQKDAKASYKADMSARRKAKRLERQRVA
jgi:hypothetical protein